MPNSVSIKQVLKDKSITKNAGRRNMILKIEASDYDKLAALIKENGLSLNGFFSRLIKLILQDKISIDEKDINYLFSRYSC